MTLNRSLASRGEAKRYNLLECQLRRFDPRFQGAVRLLAKRHPHLEDLVLSFPALLFALAVPRPGFNPASALAGVIAGVSLAEATAAAGIPMWLRKLPPGAFIRPIPKLPDGDMFRRQIGNHMPRSSKVAAIWLQTVADAADFAHEPAALWIARELAREPGCIKPARLRLVSLWLWFSGQPGTFGHGLLGRKWTPDMRIGPAIAEAKAWQERIELHVNLGLRPLADSWLKSAHVAGYDFLPLNSIAAITEEASAMRNCVCTYGATLAHNYSRLWSMRRNGERIATLSVAVRYRDPLPNIVEIKGPENTKVTRELWLVARQWLHMHDLLLVDTRKRDWETAALDRPTWLSLWRPYWLAKRRIPEWLPVAASRRALYALRTGT